MSPSSSLYAATTDNIPATAGNSATTDDLPATAGNSATTDDSGQPIAAWEHRNNGWTPRDSWELRDNGWFRAAHRRNPSLMTVAVALCRWGAMRAVCTTACDGSSGSNCRLHRIFGTTAFVDHVPSFRTAAFGLRCRSRNSCLCTGRNRHTVE